MLVRIFELCVLIYVSVKMYHLILSILTKKWFLNGEDARKSILTFLYDINHPFIMSTFWNLMTAIHDNLEFFEKIFSIFENDHSIIMMILRWMIKNLEKLCQLAITMRLLPLYQKLNNKLYWILVRSDMKTLMLTLYP